VRREDSFLQSFGTPSNGLWKLKYPERIRSAQQGDCGEGIQAKPYPQYGQGRRLDNSLGFFYTLSFRREIGAETGRDHCSSVSSVRAWSIAYL